MRFWEYFTPPAEEQAEPDVAEANVVMEFARSEYRVRLLAWLDREGSKPFSVGDHMTMIQTAVRANTIREIKNKIERDIQAAEEILKANGRI